MKAEGCSLSRISTGLTIGVGLIWVLAALTVPNAGAQDFLGFLGGTSPFVFPPGLQGEFKVTAIYTGIDQGKQTVPSVGIAWDLKQEFDMTNRYIFADLMVRLKAGRFGLRAHSETREFVGIKISVNDPFRGLSHARLDYSGIRIGADLDLLYYRGARIGINLDANLYRPIFSESIRTMYGGKKIVGDAPTTVGFYVFYTPPVDFYGISGLFEGKARFPLSGTELTDWEVAAGFAGPEAVTGTMAVKFGYRNTSLKFEAVQPIYRSWTLFPTPTIFEATFGGWFGELVYYY